MNGIQMYDRIVENEKSVGDNLPDAYWSNLADDFATRAEHAWDHLETEW